MHTRVAQQVEYFYESLDIWVDTHILPTDDGISLYQRDVTARKNAEGLRDLGVNQLQQIFDSDADSIVCIDRNWNCTFANRAALSILKTIDADFSPDFKDAIDGAKYDSAYKIAWESRRFWEQDYSIYGGISFPKQTVSVVWYPSANLFSEKGIIVAGYGVENETEFGKLNLDGKLAASRQAIEHRDFPENLARADQIQNRAAAVGGGDADLHGAADHRNQAVAGISP